MIDKYNNIFNKFRFKVVKMDVFNKCKDESKNKITYYLLTVDDVIIVDYKIIFHQINIKDCTTKSHENSKRLDLQYRLHILSKLGIKHEFKQQGKKSYFFKDSHNVKAVNDYLACKDVGFELTFQQIEYILTGSNPGGQGKSSRGYLYTMYNGKAIPFGLFLKSVNQCKNFQNYAKTNFDIHDFSGLYEMAEQVSFQDWIDHNGHLEKYVKKFHDHSEQWKTIRDDLVKEYQYVITSFYQLERKVNKYRSEQKRWIQEQYSENATLYHAYFNITNIHEDYEVAHIKPVWLIKEEYSLAKDPEILNQIRDVNNFLPLPSNIHWSYDRKQFYWTQDGCIKKLITNKLPNNIDEFKQINPEMLNKISYFINEYKIKIIDKQQ